MTQNLACSRKRETMTDQTDQSTSLVALRGRVVTPDTVIDDGVVAWDRDTIIWVGDAAAQEAPSSCLLYTSPSPRDKRQSRMPSSA